MGNVFISFQGFNYKLRFHNDFELFPLSHIGASISYEIPVIDLIINELILMETTLTPTLRWPVSR